MIRAILFDKDGTLLDFDASWRGLVQDLLEELVPGAEPHRAALRNRMSEIAGLDPVSGRFRAGSPIVAGSTAEVAALWAAEIPGGDARRIERQANQRAAQTQDAGPHPAAPDMAGLMAGFRARGLALGIATHDAEAPARAHMAALGIADQFDFFAGYDSGHGLKPGPGMVLAFARAVGVAPAEIAMIGDSLHDLGAGRAAGAGLVVGVLTGPADRETLAPHADHVIASIADLPALLR